VEPQKSRAATGPQTHFASTLRLAEDLSAKHTELLGSAAVDLWHVGSAILLEADTFWTFDEEQRTLARVTKKFNTVA